MELKELFKEHTSAVETRLEELGANTGEIKARLDTLEQKTSRGVGSWEPSATATVGQQFVDSPEVKSFIGNAIAGRRIGAETKATTLTSLTTDAAGSVGSLWDPQRDGVLGLARRRMTIRNLIPTVQVSSGSVEYPRIKAVTNAAATVAEGALKAQSDMQVDLVSVPIRTIAHWMLASRQVLDDAPQLQGLIDSELMFGLELVEENQLLNGGGTGTDLNGIYTQATAFAAGTNVIATPTKMDVLLFAMLQATLTEVPPTGIVLHPSDWIGIRATKNVDGAYIMGPPSADVAPMMFGLPVALTQAQTAGTFTVGDFAGSATIYDRWQKRVEVSTEDSDNFRRNLITVLAEERIGLAVKRPTAFIKGTFSTAITDLTS